MEFSLDHVEASFLPVSLWKFEANSKPGLQSYNNFPIGHGQGSDFRGSEQPGWKEKCMDQLGTREERNGASRCSFKPCGSAGGAGFSGIWAGIKPRPLV